MRLLWQLTYQETCTRCHSEILKDAAVTCPQMWGQTGVRRALLGRDVCDPLVRILELHVFEFREYTCSAGTIVCFHILPQDDLRQRE